jgi:hypothetical protein
MVTIDLTQDDDEVASTGEQKGAAVDHQAIADAKAKEARRRQEQREVGKAERKLKNLDALRSGRAQAQEILSDEEPTVKSPSKAHRHKVDPKPPTFVALKKAHTGSSSTQAQSPATNAKLDRLDADRTSGTLAESRSVLSDFSRSFPSAQRRAKDQTLGTLASAEKTVNERIPGLFLTPTAKLRVSASIEKEGPASDCRMDGIATAPQSATQEALRYTAESPKRSSSLQSTNKMKSSTNDKTKRVTLKTSNTGDPGVRSPTHSPAHKVPPKEPRDNQSLTNEHIHARATKSSIPDPFRLLTAQTDADRNMLPTPALTPASLADNLTDAEQLMEGPGLVRLHVDDIQRVLERHINSLREHQEDLVKHRLGNAMELHEFFPGPEKQALSVNPFKSLLQREAINSKPLTYEKHQSVVMRTTRIPAKAGNKPSSLSLQVSGFSANAQEVPKVKSIGRLGASRDLLARNVRILTHMPWFEDNEAVPDPEKETNRYADVRHEYEIDIKKLSKQRRCRAVSDVWRPQVLKLFVELGIEIEDVVYYLMHKDENEQPAAGTLSSKMNEVWNERTESCESCKIEENDDCRGPEGRRIISLIKRPPTERRLAMAGLLCAVFVKVTKFNLWHIVSETRFTKRLQQHYIEQLRKADNPSTDILATFCYACCEFKCMTHGAYIDTGALSNDDSINSAADSSQGSKEEKQPSSGYKCRSDPEPPKEVVLDDPELGMNTRVYAALPVREKDTRQHRCGVFCIDVPVAHMLGWHSNGTISGAARLELQDPEPPTFDDNNLCQSKVCFWATNHRKQAKLEALSQDAGNIRSLLGDKADLFQTLLPMDLTSRRGPCELAMAFPRVTCLEIFYLMLCSLRVPAHSDMSELPNIVSPASGVNIDLSNDKTLQLRNSFVPCSHTGPCQPGTCSCANEKVSCEPSCGCSGQCPRRFKGCTCRDQRRKVCFEDNRCECWANNRECYPELCAGCGVQEVLDPVNKGRQNLELRCRNNRIQLGIPKRTVMGVSEVHGWGLYAGEDIAKFDFISEYKGELISIDEGNRRGSVYHTLGREYLFKLSKDQELDGSRVSNKARFINNSSLTKNINVLPRLLLCNGVSRIILYAARDIAAGEELFYDYGYHKEKRANFKEKPDPAKRPILLTSKSASQITPSQVSSTAPSVRSEPALFVQEDTMDEPEDEPEDESALPTSEPASEYDILEQETETSSENERSDTIPPSSPISGPSGLRRPASRGDSSTRPEPRTAEFFSSPPQSPNDRPKKKLRLTQPRRPPESAPESDSDNPPSRRKTSNTQEEPKKPTNKRVEDSKRRRKIHPNDKRLGGAIQRKAAEVRKKRKAEQEALLGFTSAATPSGRKRKKKNEATDSPAQQPSSSQPLMRMRLKLSRPKQLASGLSQTPSPEPPLRATQLPDRDINVDDQEQDSASMAESDDSASPHHKAVPDVALPTDSFSSTAPKIPVP